MLSPFAADLLLKNGMLLLHGLGMHRMKRAGFVGWRLMDVVLIVNFLAMTVHLFGVHAITHFICIVS
ncbi:hypothetical protein P8452_29851 [Trifolium repens]|nr:hypothetical protein P8452_29851 [Trifolium repens]